MSRVDSLKGVVFANTATTVIPTNPVTGVSYRNSEITDEQIKKGWAYNTLVDSATFNQIMYVLTRVFRDVEQQGILQWSTSVDYQPGAICCDGKKSYRAKIKSGPTAGKIVQPSTNEAYWELFGEVDYDSLPKAVPVGTILSFAGPASKIPDGYILCNGTAVSRTYYKDLFAALGTTWGAGNGSTTFNVPDLRGRFLRGTGKPTEWGPDDPTASLGMKYNESLPDIQGHFGGTRTAGDNKPEPPIPPYEGAFYELGSANDVDIGDEGTSSSITRIGFKASRYNSVYLGTHVTPINCAVTYIIKATN